MTASGGELGAGHPEPGQVRQERGQAHRGPLPAKPRPYGAARPGEHSEGAGAPPQDVGLSLDYLDRYRLSRYRLLRSLTAIALTPIMTLVTA
jgi:hypothetical protein